MALKQIVAYLTQKDDLSGSDFLWAIIIFCRLKVDLRHEAELRSPSPATYQAEEDSPTVDPGIDLSDFYMSVEWDILEVPLVTENVFSCYQKLYVETMGVF